MTQTDGRRRLHSPTTRQLLSSAAAVHTPVVRKIGVCVCVWYRFLSSLWRIYFLSEKNLRKTVVVLNQHDPLFQQQQSRKVVVSSCYPGKI